MLSKDSSYLTVCGDYEFNYESCHIESRVKLAADNMSSPGGGCRCFHD